MNLSISLLRVSNYYHNSPFISISRCKSNSLDKITASRFFHNFLFTTNFVFFHIQNSNFKHFLQPIVKQSLISPNIYENQHITKKNKYTEASIFRKCSFSDLSTYEEGGFITTDFKIELYECSFQNAKTKIGSCIHSTNDVIFMHSSTEDCDAHEKAASIFQMSDMCSLICNQSTFISNQAQYSSVIHKRGIGKTIFHSLNFSKNTAKNCVGCAEINDVRVSVEYSYFWACNSYVHDGALLMKGVNSALVKRCFFHKCSHNSQTYNAAAAVCFLDCPVESRVIESAFYSCKPSSSYVVSPGWNGGLHIAYCNFTNPKKESIYSNSITVIFNCLYNHNKSDEFVYFKTIDIVSENNHEFKSLNTKSLVFVFIFSLLLTLCLNYIQKRFLHYYRISRLRL